MISLPVKYFDAMSEVLQEIHDLLKARRTSPCLRSLLTSTRVSCFYINKTLFTELINLKKYGLWLTS